MPTGDRAPGARRHVDDHLDDHDLDIDIDIDIDRDRDADVDRRRTAAHRGAADHVRHDGDRGAERAADHGDPDHPDHAAPDDGAAAVDVTARHRCTVDRAGVGRPIADL
jgi:hypothetical protein